MVEYEYQGVDRSGKKASGKLDAPNEGEVRMMLRGQGIRPTKISKVGAMNMDIGSLFSAGKTVKIEVLVGFTRQLQILIGSGIPLVQGLEILIDQSADATMKNVATAIKEKVSSGSYLWESLSGYPLIFPKLYIALVRAGESSGALDTMLKRLTRYLEDEDRIKKMVKSTMMYPIGVMLIGTLVVGLMLVFVIPKFEQMLSSAGQELPGPTLVIIKLSHFLINNILAIIVTLSVSIYIAFRYFKSDEGRGVMDRILFTTPIFGPITQKSAVARFTRTMQTLLSSGVNLIDAIDICRATVDNAVVEDAVSKIRSEVEGGKTLGAVVSKLTVFPRMAVQMIMVGESTGNLDKMLEKVADLYENEVEILVGGMTKLIEPLVLVFLGGTVGGMMIAMYLPIFKLAGGME